MLKNICIGLHIVLSSTLFASEFNGEIILRVNDHEHPMPDLLGEEFLNAYTENKSSIESEVEGTLITNSPINFNVWNLILTDMQYVNALKPAYQELYTKIQEQAGVSITYQIVMDDVPDPDSENGSCVNQSNRVQNRSSISILFLMHFWKARLKEELNATFIRRLLSEVHLHQKRSPIGFPRVDSTHSVGRFRVAVRR